MPQQLSMLSNLLKLWEPSFAFKSCDIWSKIAWRFIVSSLLDEIQNILYERFHPSSSLKRSFRTHRAYKKQTENDEVQMPKDDRLIRIANLSQVITEKKCKFSTDTTLSNIDNSWT